MIGKTISHYKILDELGRGGMGTVYKALDTKLDRFVALKFLPPHLSQDDEAKNRFIHEAKAASALDHPNICTIHEIGETDDGQSYIAMACYEGENLKDRIFRALESKGDRPDRPTGLTIAQSIDITGQIAGGLARAHEQGIVHRDIKPANILITEDSVVKIVDFGLAKLAGQTKLTKTGSTLGTVVYMSPEQARGDDVDARTDIWALGVILYEMLTGRASFSGEYEQAVIYSSINEQPESVTELRSDIPPALEQVVNRALEKDPDKRYQSMRELLDDVESLSAGIVPDEIQARMRKVKLLKRRKTILYGLAAGVLIAVVTVMILVTGQARAIASIAVLPLKNLTGSADLEYFVDGATDELIGALGQISGLKRVISRTSMMNYKETDLSLAEIAKELNVDAIVEGTVYEVSDSIRIRFQLIDALPEEKNLWGETYERPLQEVLMMYSEVTRAVVLAIKTGLTRKEQDRFAKAHPVNPEAHEAYLRGMYYLLKVTPGDFETAERYFDLALEKDPSFAPAYTGRALLWLYRNQMGIASPEEAAPKAKAASWRALELDPNSADAHHILASIKTYIDWDWEGAGKSWERTLELNPNVAMAQALYAHFLAITGHVEKARIHSEKAAILDPFNPLIQCWHAQIVYTQRRYDEAIVIAREAQRIHPNHPIVRFTLWLIMNEKEELHKEAFEAIKAMMTAVYVDPRVAAALEEGYTQGGYTEAMKRGAESMIARLPETFSLPNDIGNLYIAAGEKDRAIEWFEKGFEVHDPVSPYLSCSPLYDDIRSDPRIQDLLRRMNLSE